MTDLRPAPAGSRRTVAARALEGLLAIAIVWSVLAVGGVYPWAYRPLWIAALLAALAAGQAALGQAASRAALRGAPLLAPGLLLGAFTLVQLIPLPQSWVDLVSPGRAHFTDAAAGTTALTLSASDTWRGLAFLSSMLGLHAAAAIAYADPKAHRRLFRDLPFLGLLLAVVAAVQLGSGTDRVYGIVRPQEGSGNLFGPFVNRNHFAGYMLMLTPLALGVVARRFVRYWEIVRSRPGLSRILVFLGAPEGTALLYAGLPAAACVTGLLATTSRGGILAFGGALCVSALLHRRRQGILAAALSLALVGVGLGAFGIDRLQDRFSRASQETNLRTVVWRDSLHAMKGLWWTGSGYNTFATVSASATAWALPRGASPWPQEWASALVPRAGVRVAPGATGWYREAHNDYLQILVESGVPGLLLTLWAAVRLLRRAAADPWLTAALAGVLLHEVVDFDLQIPAVSVLFVILAGAGPRPESQPSAPHAVPIRSERA